MLIGTYLDLFTGDFDSVCVYDYEEFVHYLHERGKNVLLLTADPEVPYFINAVVEEASLEDVDWDEEEVISTFESGELS